MPGIEKSLVRLVRRNIVPLAVLVAVIASVLVRIPFMSFMTWDMEGFLLPWVEQFRTGGLALLREGVGNYNILYLLYLALISKLPVSPMLMIKLLSTVFDYALAGALAWLLYTLRSHDDAPTRKKWALLLFCVAILLPLPFINSALWGQCDSIYATFAVLAIICLLKNKNIAAFVWFGLALCLKFQAIFLLPLLIMVYAANRRFTVGLFVLPPVMMFLASLPAVLQGAKWYTAFAIYGGQTGYDPRVYVNYPGLPALVQDERFEFFSPPAVVIALVVCFAMLAWMLYKRLEAHGEALVMLAAWSVLACVLFLPAMHERYAYIAEMLLVALFFARPTKGRAAVAVVFGFSAYCAYASYLFGFWPIKVEVLAIASLLAFAWYTRETLRAMAPVAAVAGGQNTTVYAAGGRAARAEERMDDKPEPVVAAGTTAHTETVRAVPKPLFEREKAAPPSHPDAPAAVENTAAQTAPPPAEKPAERPAQQEETPAPRAVKETAPPTEARQEAAPAAPKRETGGAGPKTEAAPHAQSRPAPAKGNGADTQVEQLLRAIEQVQPAQDKPAAPPPPAVDPAPVPPPAATPAPASPTPRRPVARPVLPPRRAKPGAQGSQKP